MLTRRIFRQLTDSILLDIAKPLPCLSACSRRRLSPSSPPNLHSPSPHPSQPQHRYASSSSSTRWKSRQSRDPFTRASKVSHLASRAAFKLLQIDSRYRLFKPGQTVVDLGYAPGSWSQVAVSKTSPGGRVVGIDILPVQPPKGVSTIQGNFLSEAVQEEVRRFVRDEGAGRARERVPVLEDDVVLIEDTNGEEHGRNTETNDLDLSPEPSISTIAAPAHATPGPRKPTLASRDASRGLVVDLLLSDMCAPWPQTSSLHSNSVSNPYRRMSNTSGIPFKDHVASMDLCMSALKFAFDTLRTGGGFVCKFFAGAEDKAAEGRMKKLFERVVREKPEGSRGVSLASFL